MFHTHARTAALIGASLVLTIALSGCGNSDTINSDGIVQVNGSEPHNPLVPTNTNENGGGKIVEMIFAGLVSYDAHGKTVNDVARSIETNDAQHYSITIRDDAVFTNGERVTAQSFVGAWNYGAMLSNKQLNAGHFEDIQGFSSSRDSQLSGLSIVNETTFTVTLERPISDFPERLGFPAFYPLPTVAYDDMAAFGNNPVGNGPYRFASPNAWKHNERLDLVRNDTYTGSRKPRNSGIGFVFYSSLDSAYADLRGGNLDLLDQFPDSALELSRDELNGRVIEQPAAVLHSFTIPERLQHFGGEEGVLRRQAISHAINRDEMAATLFAGTRISARDFTSPVIDGYQADIPGNNVLDYDPEKAQSLWAQANVIASWTGTLRLAYNADGGHSTWVDAMVHSLRDLLGIDAAGEPYPTTAQLRSRVTSGAIDSAFRTGWRAGYPGLFNFLGPLYGTGGAANDSGYSNEQFDSLLRDGLNETDETKANNFFRDAQEILMRDLPAIPLWYGTVTAGYSPTVRNVSIGWNTVPLYFDIEK